MTAKLEAAVIDSHREFFRHKPKHVRPVGSPCPNCEATLQGPWCHACGQSAEEMHRSVLHLVMEAVEGFTHFDGRLWRTLPPLFLNPGKLTRDYIDGHRASQIPPLRLFLVVLLIFFFAGGLRQSGPLIRLDRTDGSVAEMKRSMEEMKRATSKLGRHGDDARVAWFKSHVAVAAEHPDRFKEVMREWVHRGAIVMLPISAAILSLLFTFQRRFYVFDHLIFSMHSLSFLGLLLIPVFLFGGGVKLVLLAAPVHLFLHMRGAYQTGVIGTLIRMAILFVLSATAFIGLMFGLILIGLSAMTG